MQDGEPSSSSLGYYINVYAWLGNMYMKSDGQIHAEKEEISPNEIDLLLWST